MADLSSTIGSLAAIWPKTAEEKKRRNQRHGRPWIDDPEDFVCRSSCSQPGCEWSIEGPVGETSVAFREHLASAHPDVRPPERRSRRR